MPVLPLPVGEIETLYGEKHVWQKTLLRPGENPLKDLSGDLFDVQLQVDVGGVKEFSFKCRGRTEVYCALRKTLNCLGKETLVDATDGRLTLRFLVDRTSVEVFANDGMASMTGWFLPKPGGHALELFADGGIATIESMTVYKLKSAWR